MTLDEAIQYDEFYALIPFEGFKKVGRLTGKYYYQTSSDKESLLNLQVEVKTGWFRTKYFPLDLLKPIKNIMDIK